MGRDTPLAQAEQRFKKLMDSIVALHAKIEELGFRSAKVSRARKANKPFQDTEFNADLRLCRKAVRAITQDIPMLQEQLHAVERRLVRDEDGARFAEAIAGMASRLPKELVSLHESILGVHQHCVEADNKVESWYMAKDCEEVMGATEMLPALGYRILQVFRRPAQEKGPSEPASPPPLPESPLPPPRALPASEPALPVEPPKPSVKSWIGLAKPAAPAPPSPPKPEDPENKD